MPSGSGGPELLLAIAERRDRASELRKPRVIARRLQTSRLPRPRGGRQCINVVVERLAGIADLTLHVPVEGSKQSGGSLFEQSCADWLRVVMNRIGPDLFASCFLVFVGERLPEAVGQIAIDGKSSRRSHDRGRGQAALHLVFRAVVAAAVLELADQLLTGRIRAPEWAYRSACSQGCTGDPSARRFR